MPSLLLPATKDRTQVFVKVTDYAADGVPPETYVVPLSGAGGATNSVKGEVTLVAGVATIAAPSVTASSTILLSRRTVAGTAGFMGFVRNPGTGFSITNSSATDTSIVGWVVIN